MEKLVFLEKKMNLNFFDFIIGSPEVYSAS